MVLLRYFQATSSSLPSLKETGIGYLPAKLANVAIQLIGAESSVTSSSVRNKVKTFRDEQKAVIATYPGSDYLKLQNAYHISSKNSASLIFRHPFAQMGSIISNSGKGNPKYFTSWSLFRINFMQSDECFSNAWLTQYFVNMVAAHHSLNKQTRHTTINIPRYSRRHFDRVPVVTLLIIRHLCISMRNLQFNPYLFRQDATIIIFILPNF